MRIDESVRRMINDGADESAIAAHAFARSETLSAAARRMVEEGATTPEEAVRVSRREDHE